MHNNSNESITGEIGSVASKVYEEKSRNLHLNDEDVFIEIGPLFGTATHSIVRGMLKNPKRTTSNKLYVYDSFKYDINNSFAKKIIRHAIQLDMLDFIQYKPNAWVSFEKVFYRKMKKYINSQDIIVVKDENLRIKPPLDCSIAFMRVNISKRYIDIKSLLFRFLSKTRVSSIIVYDDFFDHWSSSVMLALGFLIGKKCITLIEAVESSVICCVIKIPDNAELLELDLLMQNTSECLKFFDVISHECKKAKIKVPQVYLHTITLAKIQWLYERGEHQHASNILVNFFDGRHELSSIRKLINPYLDLLGNGFSVDKMYTTNTRITIPKSNMEII